mmetsp:Transcript_16802/g.57882  ORF Transcript_16802/g.57882 Transcript_16802/m.57882 type:complete len:212 (+) Transcript_16802:356-991(+)
MSKATRAPSSPAASAVVGVDGSQHAASTLAPTANEAPTASARASRTASVPSSLPVSSTASSAPCQATAATLSAWWLSVIAQTPALRSQSFTVASADPEASTVGEWRAQLRDMTASAWLPSASSGFDASCCRCCCFFFFFFFSARGFAPSDITGSIGSMTSRSQISMTGSKVPTAAKESALPPVPIVHHSTASGNAGKVTSWCTYSVPASAS